MASDAATTIATSSSITNVGAEKVKRGPTKPKQRSAPTSSINAALPIEYVKPKVQQTLFGDKEQLLVVGDGDFTFSLSLARQLRPTPTPSLPASDNKTLPSSVSSSSPPRVDASDVWLVSTSIDSEETLLSRYGRARDVLLSLHQSGVRVYHGVDGTQLETHQSLSSLHDQGVRYDAVIFNFPHHGGKVSCYC
jgi:hypothetical protein